MIALFAAILLSSAQAAGLDGQGFAPVPSDGDPGDPLTTWRPERTEPLTTGLEALFEYVESPLVQEDEDGNVTPLVDDLFALDLGVTFSPLRWMRVAVSMPVFLASRGPDGMQGTAAGDLRLSLPTTPWTLNPDGTGPGVAVVPWLELPTGATARNLGSGGPSGGLSLPFGWRNARFGAIAHVDLELGPVSDLEPAGPRLGAGLALSVLPIPALAIQAEARMRTALAKAEVPGVATPGEALLSARYRHPIGFQATLGGAIPFTGGAGAAFRAFAGVGWTFGAQRDVDADGLVKRDDRCPNAPETWNGWHDGDGCPDDLARFTLRLEDAQGEPAAGVTVREAGRVLGLTDEEGTLVLSDQLPRDELVLTLEHPHLKPTPPLRVRLPEGDSRADGVVEWLPGRVRVVTRGPGGPITDAFARFAGARRVPSARVEGGEQTFYLAPGTWTVQVSASAFGVETRTLDIGPDETSLVLIDVDLFPGDNPDADLDDIVDADDACPEAPETPNGWRDEDGCPDGLAEVRVTFLDVEGRPVSEVEVVSGTRVLGATDDDGTLRIGGRTPGGTLSVSGAHFLMEPFDEAHVALHEGVEEKAFVGRWLPGRVMVVTRSERGPILDAVARFDRIDTPLPAAPNAAWEDDWRDLPDREGIRASAPVAGGEHLFFLAPGRWRARVSAESFGIEERVLEVRPDETASVVVDVQLAPGDNPDLDLDGLLNEDDPCPRRPETPNGWRDDDGCPDDLAHVTVRVVDERGEPIEGAAVGVGADTAGETDEDGLFRLPAMMPGQEIVVDAAHFLTEPGEPVHLVPNEGEQSLELRRTWLPGRVYVVTRTSEGPITDALARFESGFATFGPSAVTEGAAMFYLAPGAWLARVSADSFGIASRELTILPDETSTVVVEVELLPGNNPDIDLDGIPNEADPCPRAPETENGWLDGDGCPDRLADLRLVVVDQDGHRVPDVAFTDDQGAPLGRTNGRGELLVAGRMPGTTLTVTPVHPHMEPSPAETFPLIEGEASRTIPMTWLPGRVWVVTRTPNGPIPDALARFDGPGRLPPEPVDGGEQLFFLSPGDWTAQVSAASFGIESRELHIEPDQTSLVLIEVELLPGPNPDIDLDDIPNELDACPRAPETRNGWRDEDGCPDALAEVVVRVLDTDGRPVPGAKVRVDGEERGLTDADGRWVAGGERPEARFDLFVEHRDAVVPAQASPLLVEGRQQVDLRLAWRGQPVTVAARGPDGRPRPVQVLASGPGERSARGEPAHLTLPPGRWRLLVVGEGQAVERVDVDVLRSDTAERAITVDLHPARLRLDGDRIDLLERLRIDSNEADVHTSSVSLLEEIGSFLLANPWIEVIEVQGHTDDVGPDDYNLWLAQQRVDTLRQRLIAQGIDPRRLRAKSYGEAQPLASNATAAGRALNRRVDFVIVSRRPEGPPGP